MNNILYSCLGEGVMSHSGPRCIGARSLAPGPLFNSNPVAFGFNCRFIEVLFVTSHRSPCDYWLVTEHSSQSN